VAAARRKERSDIDLSDTPGLRGVSIDRGMAPVTAFRGGTPRHSNGCGHSLEAGLNTTSQRAPSRMGASPDIAAYLGSLGSFVGGGEILR